MELNETVISKAITESWHRDFIGSTWIRGVIRYQVSGIRYQVSGVRYQVSLGSLLLMLVSSLLTSDT